MFDWIDFLMYFQKGFVEADVADGLLEIFGLKQGWHASFVMVELTTAKHLAQVPRFFVCVLGWIAYFSNAKKFEDSITAGECKVGTFSRIT